MSGGVALWFTSDTHFGDHRAINLHRRPFDGVAETDRRVERRGRTGRRGLAPRRLRPPTGRCRRAAGAAQRDQAPRPRNNDAAATGEAAGWASVHDYAELTVDGTLLVLCHYPFRSWHGQHRRSVNLHGHSHGKLKPLPRQHDVGVDPCGFRPVTLTTLLGFDAG